MLCNVISIFFGIKYFAAYLYFIQVFIESNQNSGTKIENGPLVLRFQIKPDLVCLVLEPIFFLCPLSRRPGLGQLGPDPSDSPVAYPATSLARPPARYLDSERLKKIKSAWNRNRSVLKPESKTSRPDLIPITSYAEMGSGTKRTLLLC